MIIRYICTKVIINMARIKYRVFHSRVTDFVELP